MKGPDKIYVREFAEGLNQMWSHIKATETSAIAQHEYIRKDALLEWAEEMKEQVGLGLNAYDMGEENGKADMLNALIDKINSM
ncbi:MAG: hypothetical protein IJP77_06340 [Bacteroidales bacterium]|nr:hypothetical protein [Bacteroidales bacterium]